LGEEIEVKLYMIVIPAIDLINGACVRLTKGKFNTLKKYYENPVGVAENWKRAGAEWLHIVDLDGARTGRPENLKIVSEIKKRMNIKIQYGGGVRSDTAINKVLEEGANRVILGTRALEDEEFLKNSLINYKDKVMLSLDYGEGGIIFKDGWRKKTDMTIFEIIRNLEKLGAKDVIITDILRDGTLGGINFDFLQRIIKDSKMKFIIAGGISSIGDIINLKKIEKSGIKGVIIGKALYEGENKINLMEAIRIGKGNGKRNGKRNSKGNDD
jgi:phosphoribosylformimino-5-aminoimidazole carboxamide ribotide isomerase